MYYDPFEDSPTPRVHARLVINRALAWTFWAVLRDASFTLFPAAILAGLLYLGVIGRKLAVGELQSWLIVLVGFVFWAVFIFAANLARGAHIIWVEDQQSLQEKDNTINELSSSLGELTRSLVPALTVQTVPPASRFSSPDGRWKYGYVLVHNTGVEPLKNCYAKLTSFSAIQAPTVPLIPAPGRRFRWSNLGEQTATDIAGGSNEALAIGCWCGDTPEQWLLEIPPKPESFPLEPGVWDILIELGADNVPATPFHGRLTYVPPNDLLIEKAQ